MIKSKCKVLKYLILRSGNTKNACGRFDASTSSATAGSTTANIASDTELVEVSEANANAHHTI